MSPRTILVTGVARRVGARLAARLAADPGVGHVIGVDTTAPTLDLGRTEFVRADIRNPLIGRVIAGADVDTVVHTSLVATPLGAGGRAAMKEINVIGTMQLLAACQKAPGLERLVVKSTAAVYGSSPRDPALFTEDVEPRALPRGGYGKDAVEVEGYVRGFGRRRPDVALSMLRFANIIGPESEGVLARYFALPVVLTVLGFDPRLQLLHEDDAVEVLRQVSLADHPGTTNVAGDGVLLVTQAARRAGRPVVPVPSPLVGVVAKAARRAGVDVSVDQLRLLQHGRVVDTTRLREVLGITPAHSTAQAFQSYLDGRLASPVVDPQTVAKVEQSVRGILSRGRVAGG